MTRGLLTPGTCFQKGGQKYTGEREGPQSYLRGASICRASENSWNPKGHSTLIRGARLGDQLCPSSASNPEQVVTSLSFARTGDEHLHLHQSHMWVLHLPSETPASTRGAPHPGAGHTWPKGGRSCSKGSQGWRSCSAARGGCR